MKIELFSNLQQNINLPEFCTQQTLKRSIIILHRRSSCCTLEGHLMEVQSLLNGCIQYWAGSTMLQSFASVPSLAWLFPGVPPASSHLLVRLTPPVVKWGRTYLRLFWLFGDWQKCVFKKWNKKLQNP